MLTKTQGAHPTTKILVRADEKRKNTGKISRNGALQTTMPSILATIASRLRAEGTYRSASWLHRA